MPFFWNRRQVPWDPATAEPPWGSRPSIYRHIQGHLSVDGKGLSEGGDELPDEERVSQRGVRWVAGGLDGAFGHHGGATGAADRAEKVYKTLRVVLREATTPNLAKLYELLLEDGALALVDPFLERLTSRRDVDAGRLGALAEWLARNAADREPVKWAIAVLGVVSTESQDLLMTLGRHEEFTLYAAVALSNSAPEPEKILFDLGQHVHGWGRIQIVERLAETTDPAIMRWLLREGYKNSIMHEYLAYTCATAGGLLSELNADSIDAELLAATGDLLRALIAGGPAQGMDEYGDGPRVVERYLHHLGATPSRLESLLVIDTICRYVGRDQDWTTSSLRGWTTEHRAAVRSRCEALIALPHWRPAVLSGLDRDDDAFYLADEAARILGIDTWERHFGRLAKTEGNAWFYVMRTSDPERIDRVVAYAEQHLPLDLIATGPGTELGLGREWAAHSNLDCVLQDLSRFPGKGWTLIRTGLRSPVIRNRHMALRAISAWEKAQWPADAEERLRGALAIEVDDDVRQEIQAVLDGKPVGPKRVEGD